MKRNKQAVLAAILAIPFAAGAQGLVSQRSISVDAAQEAATAALAQCRKGGHHVTVTVLDRFARTRVILNDDGANPHSFEHSLRKAYTALTYRTPSGEYGRRAVANPTGIGALHLDKITTAAGGLPIRAGTKWWARSACRARPAPRAHPPARAAMPMPRARRPASTMSPRS